MKAHSFLILGIAILLAACEPTMANRGNILDPDKLAEIKVGASTREDVATKLGTPTEVGTFDDKTWYYVGRQTKQYSFLDPEVVKQQAVEVHFDDKGIVTALNNLDLSQAQNIELAPGATPTYGRTETLMKQLLGDVAHPSVAGQRTSNPGKRKLGALFRRQPLRHLPHQISSQCTEKRRQIGLQARKAGGFFQRTFVHIKPAVDFELQRMLPGLRPAVAAHDLHALIRIVQRDAVAHLAQQSRRRGW